MSEDSGSGTVSNNITIEPTASINTYTFKMNEDTPELTIHRPLNKKEREQGVRAIFKYLSTHEIDLNTEFGAEGFTDQKDLLALCAKLEGLRACGEDSEYLLGQIPTHG